MRALLASPLGLLIGISLGALGGGGSILAVPALVYGAGQTPKHATTTSLILVAITALIGLVPHWRARRVRFAAGATFGLAGIGGSLLGSHWNRIVDPNALLLAFSVLMLVAAGAMWRRNAAPPVEPRAVGAAVGISTSERARGASRTQTVVKVVAAGTFVGLLTGFFGVGGGFVIVPALVLALGFEMPEAAATSLLVIAINAAVALATRLQAGSAEWHVIIPFTVASLIGVVIGGRLATTRSPAVLQRWFVMLLVAVAIYTGVRSGIQL